MGLGPADPQPATEPAVASGRPVRLLVTNDLERGRLSVLFRLLLALPFLIWLGIWAVAAFFAAIFNWAIALVLGRPNEDIHGFLARFVRYATHVYAFLNLAAEPFPGIGGRPGYRVDVEIDPPGRQNRWTVAFRIVLAVPALFLAAAIVGRSSSAYDLVNLGRSSAGNGLSLLAVAAVLGWFAAIALGRIPRGLRDLVAYALSYGAQLWAYLLILTDRYPSSDPLTAVEPLPTRADPVWMENGDDLRRSRLTVFFRLPLALPALLLAAAYGSLLLVVAVLGWFAALFTGRMPLGLRNAGALALRYTAQLYGYLFLVTGSYPYSGPCFETSPTALPEAVDWPAPIG